MSDKRRPILNKNKKLVVAFLAVMLVAGLSIGIYKMSNHTSVVPEKIQKSVNFSLYYPNAEKLPAGYTLDTQSFRLAQPGVVLFAVRYDGSKSLVFSEEEQPSSEDINKFINSYIPVNTTEQLALGQAKIGAYGSAPNVRTLVSLPIQGTWLIVTAPSYVSQTDVVKVLQTLTK